MAQTAEDAAERALFIGLDCSTQSMSAVVIDADGAVLHENSLLFDAALPGFGVTNGVRRDPLDPNHVLVPSLMFVAALEKILGDLSNCRSKFNLADVVGISGSAQQHTSVYWRRGFSLSSCIALADANDTTLSTALHEAEAFALECGPSWMDSSTITFCHALERELGGARRVAQLSGSRAYPRFTGNQIAKRLDQIPDFLDRTGRIALASSMLTSLLVGNFTSIDASDASGMNLLDLASRQWSDELVRATARHSDIDGAAGRLLECLGKRVISSHESVGLVHPFFQRKFGLSASCQVVAFSGDNPCTIAGIGLAQRGDVSISLGTSSTILAVVPPVNTSCAADEGHFLVNPVDPGSLMGMVCFKNGALAREDVRDRRAGGTWEAFETLLSQTAPGNDGTVGFFIRDPEITPLTSKCGLIAFNMEGKLVELNTLTAAAEVRAIVESQALSMRSHAERLHIHVARRLVVTGGGSSSTGLLQVLSDVFGVPVLTPQTGTNSAALGAALRAHHGCKCATAGEHIPFNADAALRFAVVATPRPDAVALYSTMLPRFQDLESAMTRFLS